MRNIILTFIIIALVNTQTDKLNDPNIQAAINIGNNPVPVSTSCGIANPKVSTDCTKNNKITDYCCFMESTTSPTTVTPFCQPISPTSYLTSMTTWKVNGTDYKINCDVVVGATGTPCGKVGPKSLEDCSTSSTLTNSCCWYHNTKSNIDYCFWIGMQMSGSLIENVQCSSSFLSFSALLGLIFFLF